MDVIDLTTGYGGTYIVDGKTGRAVLVDGSRTLPRQPQPAPDSDSPEPVAADFPVIEAPEEATDGDAN